MVCALESRDSYKNLIGEGRNEVYETYKKIFDISKKVSKDSLTKSAFAFEKLLALDPTPKHLVYSYLANIGIG